MEAMLEQDVPQAMRLLVEMNQSIESVTRLVDNMLKQVKKGEMSTDSVRTYSRIICYIIHVNLSQYIIIQLKFCLFRVSAFLK